MKDSDALKAYEDFSEEMRKDFEAGKNVETKMREAGFTPHGYCSKCHIWHMLDSKIGKAHREFIHIIGGRTK